jgi:hypothetical protein
MKQFRGFALKQTFIAQNSLRRYLKGMNVNFTSYVPNFVAHTTVNQIHIDGSIRDIVLPLDSTLLQMESKTVMPKFGSLTHRYKRQRFVVDTETMTATVEDIKSSSIMCFKTGKFSLAGAKTTVQIFETYTAICELLRERYGGYFVTGPLSLNNVVTTIYPRYLIDVPLFHKTKWYHAHLEEHSFPGLTFSQDGKINFDIGCENISMTMFTDSVTVTGCRSVIEHAHVYYQTILGNNEFSITDENGDFIENERFSERLPSNGARYLFNNDGLHVK